MADETAESLREMAQHRGLKLVKSRRRKPGTGDFGKFGLIDDKGAPLLGMGEDGLTASAQDIEDYLRVGAACTWQQSAKITPDRPMARGNPKREDAKAEEVSLRRGARGLAEAGDGAKRSKSSSSRSSRDAERDSKAEPSASTRGRESASPREGQNRTSPPARDKPPAPTPKKLPEPGPSLILRPAKLADAGSLAALLGQLGGIAVSKVDVSRDLAALRKAGAGVHIAERGQLIGCIGWAVVPTLQRGPVGRITVFVVDEDHRRQGIGTQLLAEAQSALAKKGCALIEAISDIEIKNSHNFFRTLKFEQTSYRFARNIEP